MSPYKAHHRRGTRGSEDACQSSASLRSAHGHCPRSGRRRADGKKGTTPYVTHFVFRPS